MTFLQVALSLALIGVTNTSSVDVYFREGKWHKVIESYSAIANPSEKELLRLSDVYIYSGNYSSAEETLQKIKENPDAKVSLMMLKAMKKKKYIKNLQDMLKTEGDNPRLYKAVGIAYMKNNIDEDALYYLYGATQKDPDDYMSYFYIGTIYENHLVFDLAIEAYKKAVEINPSFAQALNNLGYSYKERHYYTYAIEMYKRAIEIDPEDSGFYYNIGNAYMGKEMLKEAYESYKKAVELEPNFAKAHYNIGKSYIRMNMLEEAVKELTLYIKYWNPSIPPHDTPHPDKVEEEINELKELIKYEEKK